MRFVRVADERTGKVYSMASEKAISDYIAGLKRAQQRLLNGTTLVDPCVPDCPTEAKTMAKVGKGRGAGMKAASIYRSNRSGSLGMQVLQREGLGTSYLGDRIDRVRLDMPTRKGSIGPKL